MLTKQKLFFLSWLDFVKCLFRSRCCSWSCVCLQQLHHDLTTERLNHCASRIMHRAEDILVKYSYVCSRTSSLLNSFVHKRNVLNFSITKICFCFCIWKWKRNQPPHQAISVLHILLGYIFHINIEALAVRTSTNDDGWLRRRLR